MCRAAVTAALSVVTLLAAIGGPAYADVPEKGFDNAGASSGEASVELWAQDASEGSRETTDTTPVVGTASTCHVEGVSDDFDRSRVLADDSLVHRAAHFFYWVCDDVRQLRWYVPGVTEPAGDPVVGPLVEEAFGRLEPPVPGLVTAPPLGSEVLTGFPMYLAVDEEAFGELSGSVSAGQFTVTAWVVPVSSSFVPGDGSEPRVCEGRGSVWSAGERPSEEDCTHTFTHTPVHLHGEGESFEVSARVVYEAWYTVEGPVLAGQFELGGFEGPQVVVEVPVIERRAVRTTAGS